MDLPGPAGGSFFLCPVEAGKVPESVRALFRDPQEVPVPFRPFLTRYDTYLMRFDDICE